MNTLQAIQEAGRVWRENITDIPAIRRKLRAEAEAKIEADVAELVETRRVAAAKAIHYAIDHGATKTALRKVALVKFLRQFDWFSYAATGSRSRV
ncbi:hypothetical protein ABIB15_003085 [Marisediminicola sp. UYEF4]|uniref:hypothetical protein n=1 Tax=Marisediminicola sp. UYEF4 TaxID=1756384 RepID=UPI003394FCFB